MGKGWIAQRTKKIEQFGNFQCTKSNIWKEDIILMRYKYTTLKASKTRIYNSVCI